MYKKLIEAVKWGLYTGAIPSEGVMVAKRRYNDAMTVYVLEGEHKRLVFTSFDEVVQQKGKYKVFVFAPRDVQGSSMYDRWHEYEMIDGVVMCSRCNVPMDRWDKDNRYVSPIWKCPSCGIVDQ